jgi:hypothetical protein
MCPLLSLLAAGLLWVLALAAVLDDRSSRISGMLTVMTVSFAGLSMLLTDSHISRTAR